MGKVYQSIFGGSRQSQSSQSTANSYNQAYPFLQTQFGPMTGQAGMGADAIGALLGVGGDATKQNQAFDRFRNASGYNFLFDEGQRAVESSQAAKWLLRSGSTLSRLQNRGQQLASLSMNDYMKQLTDLSGLGLKAGEVISGAGDKSEAQSTSVGKGSSKPGIAKFLGAILSGGAG